MNKYFKKILKHNNNFIRTTGSSMYPLFHNGDIVYFEKIRFSLVRVNDLIIFQKKRRIISHRVIYRKKGYLVTKGDNNPRSDGRIFQSQIIGKIYQVKRDDQIFSPENLYLFQSTIYFKEILTLKKAFEKLKLKYIFLKGLPLYLYYQGRQPRKIYADCDILVGKNDLEKISRIFLTLGYRQDDHSLSGLHKHIKSGLSEISFSGTVNGYIVIFDIHFEITPLYNRLGNFNYLISKDTINGITAECLNSPQYVNIFGEKYPILNATNSIFFLLIHLFRHNFRGINRYEMLDRIIRTAYINYQKLGDTIKHYRFSNYIYPGFLLLIKYYQTPVDKKFLKNILPERQINDYIFSSLLKINIFDEENRARSGINRLKNLFFLSPNPLLQKILILFDPVVFFTVLWIFFKFSKRSIRKFICKNLRRI